MKFTAESKSKLGYGLLAAVNGGRLQDLRRRRLARVRGVLARGRAHARRTTARTGQMSFFVAPSDGHDDYVVSAALAVQAANDIETRPRVARGRLALE